MTMCFFNAGDIDLKFEGESLCDAVSFKNMHRKNESMNFFDRIHEKVAIFST